MAESSSFRLDKKAEQEVCGPLPGKKLARFAFRLALLEKAASTLGTLNFIWATAVVLGGLSSLESIDFWFVSIILVVEGLRILCRSGELATQAITWRSCCPDFGLSLIHVYSVVIQELSAFACIGLSSFRIPKHRYASHDNRNRNRNRALRIFYWLSLVESFLTLLGFAVRRTLLKFSIFSLNPKTSSSWVKLISEKMRTMLILVKKPSSWVELISGKMSEMLIFLVIGNEWASELVRCGITNDQFDTLRHFLYHTYCRCMNGNVFDGLKMDFVSYSVELLQSIDHNDQLTGARVMLALVNKYRFAEETSRTIGTMGDVVKRLIEMLNWDKPQEEDIRSAAAEIIYKLVEIPRNRIRVMAISESMESIASLLYDRNQIGIHSSKYQGQFSDKYRYSYFTVLGIRILKIFANDPDSCAKIGSKKGLLCKIIELNAEASESEIVRHLKITPIEKLESLARQQDVCDNINDTSGIEAQRSDDPNLQSVFFPV